MTTSVVDTAIAGAPGEIIAILARVFGDLARAYDEQAHDARVDAARSDDVRDAEEAERLADLADHLSDLATATGIYVGTPRAVSA